MQCPLLQLALRTDRDVVAARQRAREIASALGLDNQDQIRLATATSEMARNAFRYAHQGKVVFSLRIATPQGLVVTISDGGPGIPNLDEIFAGKYRSRTGLGMGIVGTRRLMDDFDIQSASDGTTVRMTKNLPPGSIPWTERSAGELARKLQANAPENPYQEIEQQNQELLKTLQDLRSRQEELELLNRELEDTNRGVVALYAELDERADYLRRASELKTRFLSNVSHEFRTPLNSIVSLARLLMDRIDGDLTPEQLKQVRYMETSARELQEMVNDLLDLAKVEAGKIRMRPKRFEVHELFSALKGMLKPLLADNSSVDLIFEDAEGLPPMHTDEGKVSQILRNLVSNALKFTPNGQVTVSAAMLDNGRVQFVVADTGIGIPPQHHDEIFKEFSQVDNPLQEKHRGTGLGLPLCRNLALLLGGQIRLESEAGQGSTFFVSLPLNYVGESASAEDVANLPAPEFHRTPVLYIEDNAESARLFETYVRDSEFQAIVASSFGQAETWTTRHVPSVVLADVHIGDDLSWGFIGRLRNRWPDLPIIVTSVDDEADAAMDWGARMFVRKPFERDEILEILRQYPSPAIPRRLLLVDDNEVARYILRELLTEPWLSIREASNAAQALEAMRNELPDGIILDLLMPDMSGFEMLRILRGKPETKNLPVLIYTSKVLNDSEKAQLTKWNAAIINKEDVATRLSAKPFLDWAQASGLAPEYYAREPHA